MLYSYEKYLLILEGKREKQLRTKYIEKIGMSKDIFNKFYKAKDTEWLLKTYNNTDDDIKNEVNEKTGLTFPDLLIKYTELFNKNKENFDIKQINKIDGIEELREVLDELRNFDEAEVNYDSDEIWIIENNYEWFIFKPYTYEVSEEYGNNKLRKNNWCTTYDENYFDKYFGSDGGLLYMVNKLDPKKDLALEMTTNIINVWDWQDSNNDTYNTLSQLIEYNTEIPKEVIKILKENKYTIEDNLPDFNYETLRDNVRESIRNSHFDDIYYSYDIYQYIDEKNFFSEIKDQEYDRWYSEWRYEDDNYLKDKTKDILYERDRSYNQEEKEGIFNYFKKMIIENNEENDLVEDDYDYKNPDDIDLNMIEEIIDDSDDITSIIEDLSYEDDIIEYLTQSTIDSYVDVKDYIESMYGHNSGPSELGWLDTYIDKNKMADDIVNDMDDEELRNYM